MAKSAVEPNIFKSLVNSATEKQSVAADVPVKRAEEKTVYVPPEKPVHVPDEPKEKLVSIKELVMKEDREKHTNKLSVWVTDQEYEAFKNKCNEYGMSYSKVLRNFINAFIES